MRPLLRWLALSVVMHACNCNDNADPNLTACQLLEAVSPDQQMISDALSAQDAPTAIDRAMALDQSILSIENRATDPDIKGQAQAVDSDLGALIADLQKSPPDFFNAGNAMTTVRNDMATLSAACSPYLTR